MFVVVVCSYCLSCVTRCWSFGVVVGVVVVVWCCWSCRYSLLPFVVGWLVVVVRDVVACGCLFVVCCLIVIVRCCCWLLLCVIVVVRRLLLYCVGCYG